MSAALTVVTSGVGLLLIVSQSNCFHQLMWWRQKSSSVMVRPGHLGGGDLDKTSVPGFQRLPKQQDSETFKLGRLELRFWSH